MLDIHSRRIEDVKGVTNSRTDRKLEATEGPEDTVSIENGDFELSGQHDAKRHYATILSLAEDDTLYKSVTLLHVNIKAIGGV